MTWVPFSEEADHSSNGGLCHSVNTMGEGSENTEFKVSNNECLHFLLEGSVGALLRCRLLVPIKSSAHINLFNRVEGH